MPENQSTLFAWPNDKNLAVASKDAGSGERTCHYHCPHYFETDCASSTDMTTIQEENCSLSACGAQKKKLSAKSLLCINVFF